MSAPKERIDKAVLCNTGENREPDLALAVSMMLADREASARATHLLSSIEHGPSAPWHVPCILKPSTQIGIADDERQNMWIEVGGRARSTPRERGDERPEAGEPHGNPADARRLK